MKSMVKRIIAREGLIILTLIILSGLSFFIDSRLRSHKRLYEATVQEISPVGMADEWLTGEEYLKRKSANAGSQQSSGLIDPFKDEWQDLKDVDLNATPKPQGRDVFRGIILRFPKNTNNDVIKQTIKRDFPNIKIKGDNWIIWDTPKNENITASYDEKGKHVFKGTIYNIEWSYVSFFFLIFAYPFYLIIRFVIWAIGTLKMGD